MTHSSLTDETAADSQPAAIPAAGGGAGTDEIRAERVDIVQGGARSIDAHTVSLQQGGATNVRASEVSVSQGGIALARAERIELRDRSGALALVAGEATLAPGSSVLLLLARNVGGEVRPLIDWRAAAAFGAGLAVVAALVRRR